MASAILIHSQQAHSAFLITGVLSAPLPTFLRPHFAHRQYFHLLCHSNVAALSVSTLKEISRILGNADSFQVISGK